MTDKDESVNLLVALDLTAIDEAVLSEAVALARSLDAGLILLHVAAPDPEFIGYRNDPEALRDQTAEHMRREHRALQSLADRVREQGVSCKALLIQGETVEAIVGEAARIGARVIVLGTHSRGLLRRVALGSTSEGVLRAADRPVHVVPAAGDPHSLLS